MLPEPVLWYGKGIAAIRGFQGFPGLPRPSPARQDSSQHGTQFKLRERVSQGRGLPVLEGGRGDSGLPLS